MMMASSRCGARNGLARAVLLLCSAVCACCWEWSSVDATGTAPGVRVGASASVWTPTAQQAERRSVSAPRESTPRIVLCGGYDSAASLVAGCTLLIPGTQWQYAQGVPAAATIGRADHTAVIAGDFLLLFSGNSSAGATGAALEVFKVGEWAAPPGLQILGTPPIPRFGHTGVCIYATGDSSCLSWVIFGGRTLDGSETDLSDVAVLDLGDGVTPIFAWTEPASTGDVPPARHYHAASPWGGSMVVVGGVDANDNQLADAWMLSLTAPTAWRWTQLQCSGAPMLSGMKALTVGWMILVLGGLSPGYQDDFSLRDDTNATGMVRYIDTRDWSWHVPSVDNAPPLGRDRPAVATFAVAGASTPQAVVFGGRNPTTDASQSDLHVLINIGLNPKPMIADLPYIIGGSAVGLLVLIVLGGLAWWHQRKKYNDAALYTRLVDKKPRASAHHSYYATDVSIAPAYAMSRPGGRALPSVSDVGVIAADGSTDDRYGVSRTSSVGASSTDGSERSKSSGSAPVREDSDMAVLRF